MINVRICVSIAPRTAESALRVAEHLPDADIVEIRLDALSTDDAKDLVGKLPTEKLFLLTLRPIEEGGNSLLNTDERASFWREIADRLPDNVWVDNELDLIGQIVQEGSRTTVRSVHFTEIPSKIEALLSNAKEPDEILKVAYPVNDAADGIPLWKLLSKARELGRRVVPIAMGEAGKWTRILGPAHGAFMTYAGLSQENSTAPGQISIDELSNVFRIRDITKETAVFGLVAGDTSYSMSPYLHNAAFHDASMNAVFLPLQVKCLAAFVKRMVTPESREIELNFKGFAVTDPHKTEIIELLDEVDETARKIGAVNTVVVQDGRLMGSNTDSDAFLETLLTAFGDISNCKVAVFGSGGAARACVHALLTKAATITVFARDVARAERVFHDLDVAIAENTVARESEDLSGFDIVVNATPLGTKGEFERRTIATADKLSGVKLVYDLVYNPSKTRLMAEAEIAGVPHIGGLEMLIKQAARQFELWTERPAPVDVMAVAARERLQL